MSRVYSLVLLAFISNLSVSSSIAMTDIMNDEQGLKIKFDDNRYKESNEILIQGTLSLFVKCGSQYAIWYQFPNSVHYTLKDLDTSEVYQSVNSELSISWEGNRIYDEYAKRPCDNIIKEKYSILLKDIMFTGAPAKTVKNFELTSSYLDNKSNTLLFKNKPVVLTGF